MTQKRIREAKQFGPVYSPLVKKESNTPVDLTRSRACSHQASRRRQQWSASAQGLSSEKSSDDPANIVGGKDKNLKTVKPCSRRAESEGSECPHNYTVSVPSRTGLQIMVIGLNEGTYKRVPSASPGLRKAELTHIHSILRTASLCFPIWSWGPLMRRLALIPNKRILHVSSREKSTSQLTKKSFVFYSPG